MTSPSCARCTTSSLHYTALFDELGLDHWRRPRRVLPRRPAGRRAWRSSRSTVCAGSCWSPLTGLRVPGVDVDDLFGIPPEELIGRLAHLAETLLPHLPDDPHDVDFTVDRYREIRSTALMLWEHPFDRVVPRWLGRVDIPTLVVWGERGSPAAGRVGTGWAAPLADATVKTFPDAGHLVLDESADAVDSGGGFSATT